MDIQKDFSFISESLRNLKFIGNLSINDTKVQVEEPSSVDEDGVSFKMKKEKASISKLRIQIIVLCMDSLHISSIWD